MAHTIIIRMTPVAKGRPRLTTRGGFARAFTPEKTRTAEAEMKRQAMAQWKMPPLAMPLKVCVTFFLQKPKYLRKQLGNLPHWRKPDLDNLVKSLDALNGVCWMDDSLIFNLSAGKFYSDTPRIEMTIEEMTITDL